MQGSPGEVFRIFLRLGLTSFGGPVAHLGYFREAFVVRRRWLKESAYADLIALCQFLPGPASSQLGMAIGLGRAGWWGLIAAWAGFTIPSAVLMVAFAFGFESLSNLLGTGWISGLKTAAVAVVAHAVVGMAKALAPDRERATIAVTGMIVALLLPTSWGQIAAIGLGAVAGLLLRPPANPPSDDVLAIPISRCFSGVCLTAFFLLLVVLPLGAAATQSRGLSLLDAFYRSGSLVFGGGHVLLPLLEAEVVKPGWVSQGDFLAGYGAAQALPGPLFTFSAYLGAVMQASPTGLLGAVLALLAIFLPSSLLIAGALPFWNRLRGYPLARRMLLGINAAVVGLLAAVFYDPVFSVGAATPETLAMAAVAFVGLSAWRLPAWSVVIGAGVVGGLFL